MADEQFGPYVLVELLGRGRHGEVHRAVDTGKSRTVAAKRLRLELATDEQFQTRFRRETALAARTSAPHVVPIHDYGEIDGQLYIDMRLVEGVDLGTVLRKGPLTLPRAVDIVSQIADALDAAHEDGLVHRDVKPSNILLVGKPEQVVERGFAYVPQGREIFPRLTVEENLLIGAASRTASRQVPQRIYDLFPMLASMKRRRGGDLSGGQQQQLAIGRALMSEPSLLILDEPTEGIQPSIIKDIGRVIRDLASRGTMAIVLVEQYFDFAKALADRFILLQRGEVVVEGDGARLDADDVRRYLTV